MSHFLRSLASILELFFLRFMRRAAGILPASLPSLSTKRSDSAAASSSGPRRRPPFVSPPIRLGSERMSRSDAAMAFSISESASDESRTGGETNLRGCARGFPSRSLSSFEGVNRAWYATTSSSLLSNESLDCNFRYEGLFTAAGVTFSAGFDLRSRVPRSLLSPPGLGRLRSRLAPVARSSGMNTCSGTSASGPDLLLSDILLKT
mmetsp:Transcript_28956/g.69000  ORF Transcript_28956/g.69000 Transcript_28956/m.69000 type:complete len:206 (-) Transcript_28956:135-752(-)